MRMIGTIPKQDQAERFSDYLVTLDVENMVEETSAGDWVVWVEHDDHLDRGKSELHAFLANPSDAKFSAASTAQKIRATEEKKAARRQRQYIDVRTRWTQPAQWAAPLTLALIAISVIVTFGTGSSGIGPVREGAINKLLFIDPDQAKFEQWWAEHPSESDEHVIWVRYWLATMKTGEIWRPITPIFVHLGLLHLLFNMFWLRDLGGMIELRRKTRVLLMLVLFCAIISNFGQYVSSGPRFGGMSGVVYGLFGYVWVKGRYEPHLGLGISQQGATIMFGWLLLCMTGLMGPVANVAHVVGLLTGAAVAFAPYSIRRLGWLKQ